MHKNFIKILARFIIRNVKPSYYFNFIYFLLVKKNKKFNSDGIVLLALNPFRFRNDLEILESEYKDILIYRMVFSFQCFLFTCFYRNPKSDIHRNINKELKIEQQSYRNFLRQFLPLVVKVFKINIVIGPGLFYRQDYDIATIFKEIGVPVLIFHREGNLATEAFKEDFARRCKLYSSFHGTAMMIHNQVQKNIIYETNYMNNNVHIIGVLRMDEWVKNTHILHNKNMLHKRVTLFSFGPGAGFMNAKPPQWPLDPENFMPTLCIEVHKTVINFAINNPKVEVVIKCKWGGSWRKSLLQLVGEKSDEIENIPNLIITADRDAQELISTSDVIIGFGSTTLLEGAVAGKAVIVPHFEEITKKIFAKNIYYKNNFDCFNIANSPRNLYDMIFRYTSNYIPQDHLIEKRHKLFENYISPLDGSARDNAYKYIVKYAEKSN